MTEARLPPRRVLARVKRITQVKNYNHDLLNIPTAWKRSRGHGVTVGVLDTGRPQHDDLQVFNSWSGIRGYEDDAEGHSTHVCGLLAARDNGFGVVGIAPDCRLSTYTVLNMYGAGDVNTIVEAIYRAMEDGCSILNMSFGIPGPKISALESVCRNAADKGVIIVAAAGNEAGAIDQPARYDCVIAVGAVDLDRRHAKFSNHGPQMDFAVGGVDVYSTYLENGYAKMSGTSMACPIFSGICAIVLGEHEARGNARGLVDTPIHGVADMIEHIKRFSYDVGPEGWDEEYGYGIPVFDAPREALELKPRDVILRELDGIQERVDALKQAAEEL